MNRFGIFRPRGDGSPAGMPRPGRLAAALLFLAALAGLAVPVAARLAAPANPHGKFHGECADCHSPSAWTPARISPRFDHAKSGFPLEGAHAAAKCTSCHGSLDFTQEKKLCISCHEDVHRGELGTECGRCHGSRSFIDRATMLRMHQVSRFPLTGSHASLECEDCHKPTAGGHLQFVGKSADCSGCHQADFLAAKSPDHAAGGFPQDCMACHSTAGWRPARFNHDLTGFPLTGAHRALVCQRCHTSGTFQGLSPACASCHMADFNGTNDPPHAASGFSTQCQTCHTTTSWSGAVFDHSGTAFPLTGAHLSATCQQCHASGVYQGLNTACVSCHQSAYDGTTNPAHAPAGFSTQCQTCHTTASWAGATFDHDTSFFPIYSGRHAGLWSTCSTCHTNSANFSVFTCFSCHPHDDQAGTNSHHTGVSGYRYDSQACYSCHPRGRAG